MIPADTSLFSDRSQKGNFPTHYLFVFSDVKISVKSEEVNLALGESIFLSRVEGSMSRARVPCRGSRVTFFFPKFFFWKR